MGLTLSQITIGDGGHDRKHKIIWLEETMQGGGEEREIVWMRWGRDWGGGPLMSWKEDGIYRRKCMPWSRDQSTVLSPQQERKRETQRQQEEIRERSRPERQSVCGRTQIHTPSQWPTDINPASRDACVASNTAPAAVRGSGVEPGEGGGELSEDVRQRVSQGRRLHLWRLPLETASQRTGATGGWVTHLYLLL